jgi:hypothetical protein
MPDLAQMPWFAGRPGRLLVYRVNRRPKYADTLLPAEIPSDVFGHFIRMLEPGYEVVTGRHHQRIWRVGGIRIDGEERMLTGRLGWQTKEDEVISQWSEEAMDWLTQTAEPKERKLMPFGFDGDSRLLSVLTDGSAPSTIAAVFEKILRENEQELLEPTTDWSVEPVLDRQDFLTWLGTLDVVTSVSFTAKLPNPEPGEAFDELYKRLVHSHATQHTETMRSEREEGLFEVEHDRDISQAIAMGQQGFATLRGKGTRDGATKSYSQTREVASESVEELPTGWDEMRALIAELLRGALRRFKDDGET